MERERIRNIAMSILNILVSYCFFMCCLQLTDNPRSVLLTFILGQHLIRPLLTLPRTKISELTSPHPVVITRVRGHLSPQSPWLHFPASQSIYLNPLFIIISSSDIGDLGFRFDHQIWRLIARGPYFCTTDNCFDLWE